MLWLRALVVYPVTIYFFRLMGRGMQFQSRPYNLLVQILIGSAATNLIITTDVQLWRAFTSLGMIVLVHGIISFTTMWNPAKKIFVGEPHMLVENGKIIKANLIRHQLSVEEVLAALREKGYYNINDVKYAMIEASGKLSVLPTEEARPTTNRDLGLKPSPEKYTSLLIADGRVDYENLHKAQKDERWLHEQLAMQGINDHSEVLLAMLDSRDQFLAIRQQDVPFLRAVFQGARVETAPGVPPHVH